MARISTYSNDQTINDNDRLIGTDGGSGIAGTAGATRNFTIGDLRRYINSRDDGQSAMGGGDFDTFLYTDDTLVDGQPPVLSLRSAYAFHNQGSSLMAVLPSNPSDGAWIRITGIGTTGVMLYAGHTDLATATAASAGNRFMAGVTSVGTAASDPHLLMVPGSMNPSFELIYIADEITTTVTGSSVTAPVGWVIVN